MVNPAGRSEEPHPTPQGHPADPAAGAPADDLAERLQRLEIAIATLQDTRSIEERLATVVTERLAADRRPTLPLRRDIRGGREPRVDREPQGLILEAPRLLPMAATLLGHTPVPPGPALGPAAATAGPHRAGRTWPVFEAINDLRLMYRMAMDPRYRMTWPAWVMVYVILPVILLSSVLWYFIPGYGLLPTAVQGVLAWVLVPVDKVVDILLAVIAYKVLTRELVRYRELVPDFDTIYGS